MVISILLPFLYIGLHVSSATSPPLLVSPLTQCSWIANVTGMVRVEEIGKHKYVILENCLYYNLSRKANSIMGRFGVLSELPPTREGQSSLLISVEQVVLREFYTSKLSPKMRMVGHMELSWNDYRLQWDPAIWKIDQLSIKTEEDIWVPESTTYENGQLLQRLGNAIIFHNIFVTSKGQVTATLEFSVATSCRSDHRNFPMDVVDCCVYSNNLLDDEILTYTVKNNVGLVDVDLFTMRWSVKEFHIDLARDRGKTINGDGQASSAPWKMCVQATRFSKTLKMQLSIPMAISGILVVVAPLFGTMQTQIFVKMFSLVMQLICFQFLISMTPTAGMGNEMPKIYSFYEVTFVVTFISLLATVILKALSRNERIIPPAHNLYLLARTFNTYVCCSNQKNENQVWKIENLSSSKDQNGGVSVDQESNQWLEMFVAVNNAISLLLVVIYVIAALTLNL